MIGNGREMKAKVAIQIYLLEDGNVAYKSSSQNNATNLGLLEIAKGLILAPMFAAKDQPLIEVPKLELP